MLINLIILKKVTFKFKKRLVKLELEFGIQNYLHFNLRTSLILNLANSKVKYHGLKMVKLFISNQKVIIKT